MTSTLGNSEFCFHRISMFPFDFLEGNIEIRWKRNSLFPSGAVLVLTVDFIRHTGGKIPPEYKL